MPWGTIGLPDGVLYDGIILYPFGATASLNLTPDESYPSTTVVVFCQPDGALFMQRTQDIADFLQDQDRLGVAVIGDASVLYRPKDGGSMMMIWRRGDVVGQATFPAGTSLDIIEGVASAFNGALP